MQQQAMPGELQMNGGYDDARSVSGQIQRLNSVAVNIDLND